MLCFPLGFQQVDLRQLTVFNFFAQLGIYLRNLLGTLVYTLLHVIVSMLKRLGGPPLFGNVLLQREEADYIALLIEVRNVGLVGNPAVAVIQCGFNLKID